LHEQIRSVTDSKPGPQQNEVRDTPARSRRRPPPLRRWQARARGPPPEAAMYGTGAQQGCGSRGERVESPWGPGLAPSSVRHGSEQSIGTDRKVHRRYGKPKGRTDNRRLKGQAEGYSEPPLSFLPDGHPSDARYGHRTEPGILGSSPGPQCPYLLGRGCSIAIDEAVREMTRASRWNSRDQARPGGGSGAGRPRVSHPSSTRHHDGPRSSVVSTALIVVGQSASYRLFRRTW